jgi:hypothetical protein
MQPLDGYTADRPLAIDFDQTATGISEIDLTSAKESSPIWPAARLAVLRHRSVLSYFLYTSGERLLRHLSAGCNQTCD